jgi:glycosyltransferase 2 family protein
MDKPVRAVVLVVLSAGLLAFFLRGAHLNQVWAEIKQAEPWLIGVAAATTIINMVFRALRWQCLLRPLGKTRFRSVFRATVVGFAALNVLPARAGEVIKPYLLARQEGLSVTSTFATVVVERVLDSVTIAMMLGSFVIFFDPGMAIADRTMYRLVRLGGLTVASGAIALLGLLFFAAGHPETLRRWAFKLEHLLPGRMTHKLAELLESFAAGLAVVREPKRLVLALMLSFPLWLTIALGVWTATLAFHIVMPFTGSFLMLALLVVGVSVPTPGGVGAFEAAYRIGATSFYAVPNDRAVGAALVVHAISVAPTVALGFLFLVQDGLNLGGVRKLATAAVEGEAP